jgi:hypothetical protein
MDHTLIDLPCGCQDVVFTDDTVCHEHDHVQCGYVCAMNTGLVTWVLVIGGIVLVAIAALSSVVSGFNAPSWCLAFGALSALVGLAIKTT